MTILTHPDLDRLAGAVRGRVLLPGHADFDQAHRPWNLAVTQSVGAVVEATDADDVARLVRFARDHRLAVAAQPSGHGATGRAADAILLRTGLLNEIHIDPVAMTARIGAGVRSGDLQRAAAAYGLTGLPGSSPVVSVTGAALGGGLSWFGRAHGWMADSILAAEVVTADGAVRRVSADSSPELLWALKGGGGDLAIVTTLEIQLRPAPEVFGGRLLWSADHAHEVAHAYRTMTTDAPAELTLWLESLHFPGGDPMIAIDVTYLGAESEARTLMEPVEHLARPMSDSRAIMSAATLGDITAEPTDPGPGQSRAELLTRFDDDVITTLLDAPIAPLMAVQVRHLGGALAEPSDSPHGALCEPFAVYMFGVPATPDLADQISRKQTRLAASLPTTGRKPITFLNPTESLADALPTESVSRLRALKDEIDPHHTIRGNFAIAG